MNEGNLELALELVTHCLQHPSTTQEITDHAESLPAELAAPLTPRQVETAEAQAQAMTLKSSTQENLAAG